MRKKCFKKAVSLALCIVMSVTMTGTPVLADTFTDGSQSIISENAEILTVDAESATDCGDVASTEENLTEPALLSETEEKFDNPEYAEFSGGNEAEVVSEFSDNSVPVAQTGGNNVVYLDSRSGNDTNDGSSVENAVGTLAKAIAIANGGIIYLLNPIDINKNVTLENVTLRPGRSTMSHMLYIRGDVTLQNIIINNITPDGTPCQFSANPIEVVPGISSMTFAFARLNEVWHDADLMSFHGRQPAPEKLVYEAGKKMGFLTDPEYNPAHIARILIDAGWPKETRAAALERLSYDDEKIVDSTLEVLTELEGFGHSVMVVLG